MGIVSLVKYNATFLLKLFSIVFKSGTFSKPLTFYQIAYNSVGFFTKECKAKFDNVSVRNRNCSASRNACVQIRILSI